MNLDFNTCAVIGSLVISGFSAIGACAGIGYSLMITPYKAQQTIKDVEALGVRLNQLELNHGTHSVTLGKLETAMANLSTSMDKIEKLLESISDCGGFNRNKKR